MAVHTFKDYSDSINRFSPQYTEEVCERVGRIIPLMDRLLMQMQLSMMTLDMLKAHAFYGKPLHEAIQVQLPTMGHAVTPRHAVFVHGLLGLLTECNEVYIGANTEGIHKVNGVEEGGDVLWFLNELLKSLSCTMAEAAAVNEAKLSTRYGEAHDNGKAITRDKAKEQAAMEAALDEVRNSRTVAVPESTSAFEELLLLLRRCLPTMEDIARHNASNSQRITVARIREILHLPPIYFKHGKNYDGSGKEISREDWVAGRDSSPTIGGQAPDSGGRPEEPQS